MKINYTKGYTLLFAVIVSAVVLSIAAFVLSSARRQFALSSISEDSLIALYAADSALQCAAGAYLGMETVGYTNGQLKPYIFIDDGSGNMISVRQDANFTCGPYISFEEDGIVTRTHVPYTTLNNDTTDNNRISGMNLVNDGVGGSRQVEQTSMVTPLQYLFANGSCARVVITQGYDSLGKHKTIVDSRGYSDYNSRPCNESLNAKYNPRVVERAVRWVNDD